MLKGCYIYTGVQGPRMKWHVTHIRLEWGYMLRISILFASIATKKEKERERDLLLHAVKEPEVWLISAQRSFPLTKAQKCDQAQAFSETVIGRTEQMVSSRTAEPRRQHYSQERSVDIVGRMDSDPARSPTKNAHPVHASDETPRFSFHASAAKTWRTFQIFV